ncbi:MULTISPECIES: LysR substrate-binding domain-containing protein [unclassified Achromobacter]|uniref:LysR substrate-binding domain-containing protein n=1 Tax=unclassified Achromobacter TaxID=2626865 RepID=UPI000B51AF55|nr:MULTISPECIES: LysR substrate-binding domain-containing protein [unclassified Achromobacter]OWT68252.1 LysR family transcriptional regulator [Achromobacter sp. HZ34]OWT70089.1 LysR family transcriptional regulator [Achromobacter sp. HZ28]
MPRLPLNTLPTFRVIAELQNLRAAAETLHLTHSAVSQQLRVLETQLGHPVFDRHGRRLSLNAAGAALLPYVKEALAQLDEGMQAAAAAASSTGQRLRLSVLPSFAQRWLLPRMGHWREQHPDIALEIESSQQLVDVRREGFHAALRQGRGPWPGLHSEKLFDHPMPMILVGSPAASRRLAGATPGDYAREPLLGEAGLWEQWFSAAGAPRKVSTVAVFNDAGLLLSAVEQNLGLAIVRELLAADALGDGRLVRLSPVEILYDSANAYQLVYPAALQNWAPLITLRDWIRDELEASRRALQYGSPGKRRATRKGTAHAASSSR